MEYPLSFRVAQAVGLSGAAWLSGNISSLSMISMPSLLRSHRENNVPTSILVKQWRHLYDYGSSQNPPLSVVVAGALFYCAWSVREGGALFRPAQTSLAGLYVAAGLLVMAIPPWTLGAMAGTNNALKKTALSKSEPSDEETIGLLNTWTTLNGIRGIFPLVGGFVGLTAAFL
ncbi:hypothetical protein N7474_011140 [Penicillium riverlandense]|uniref:uncharacterized protein n=1 Tax=Penicillium riverlandense TaxID=1903569 RepID=UPI00254827B8|nr:uncharacterized protein N7474_011140 [Penicillium riverlandense]KAJ5805253.1 hypothetical protein N7474_011140 [Penicillium riverlandense]